LQIIGVQQTVASKMQITYKHIFFISFILIQFCGCKKEGLIASNDEIYELLQKGKEEYSNGNYDESHSLFQELVFKYDNNIIKCCETEILETYNYIGSIYEKLGAFKNAEEYYSKAYHFAKEVNDKFYQKTSLNNLAYVENSHPDIKEILKKAFEIEDDTLSKGNIQLKHHYAVVLAKQGKLNEAKDILISLKNIEPQSLDSYNIAYCLMGLGILEKMSNRHKVAVEKFDSALLKLPNKSSKAEKYSILIEKAESLISLKDYTSATMHLDSIKKYVEKSNDLVLKSRINENYLSIYQINKDYDKSINIMRVIMELESFICEQLGSIKGSVLTNIQHENELANQKSKIKFLGISILLLALIFYLFLKNHKKQAEVKLLEKQHEINIEQTKLKDLQNQLAQESMNSYMNGQEEERKQHAAQLHDSLGANLAAVNMHLSLLKKDVPEKKYDRISGMLKNVITETRNISHNIMPPLLVNQGVIAAISEKAIEWSHPKLQIDTESNVEKVTLDDSLEIALYRGVLECVNNIIRSAEASKAKIIFEQLENNTLHITITDNGKGFDTGIIERGEGGLGINGVKNRIKYFKGHFDIKSKIGKGTTVYINVPVLKMKQTA